MNFSLCNIRKIKNYIYLINYYNMSMIKRKLTDKLK